MVSSAMQEQQTLACVAANNECQQRSRTALQDRGGKDAMSRTQTFFRFGYDVVGL